MTVLLTGLSTAANSIQGGLGTALEHHETSFSRYIGWMLSRAVCDWRATHFKGRKRSLAGQKFDHGEAVGGDFKYQLGNH